MSWNAGPPRSISSLPNHCLGSLNGSIDFCVPINAGGWPPGAGHWLLTAGRRALTAGR